MTKERFVLFGGIAAVVVTLVTLAAQHPIPDSDVHRSVYNGVTGRETVYNSAGREESPQSQQSTQPQEDLVKSTKAYAQGYADGKLWAENNDVPDRRMRTYIRAKACQARMAETRNDPVFNPQSAFHYADGYVDGVFGD